MVPILFSTGPSLASKLVKATTWSKWSHVEILNKDNHNMLIGANAPKGVVYKSMVSRIEESTVVVQADFPGDFAKAWSFAESQLGTPYDWLGAAGMGFHRNWEKDDAWFCSELVAASLAAAGYCPYRAHLLRRIVPQHLWMLNIDFKVLKGKV